MMNTTGEVGMEAAVASPGVARNAEGIAKYARRLPVGAEVQAGGGVHFRVWAARCQSVVVEVMGQESGDRGQGERSKVQGPKSKAEDQGQETGDRSQESGVRSQSLSREENGYFSGFVRAAEAGDRYWFLVDGDESRLPDPVSRFQPEGPHGPSEIVDPSAFAWRDEKWRGVKLAGQVIYELHIGTFTAEGTWEAAARELPELASAGITLIEVMPVAAFPGRFNWGYDGVDLYAPAQVYGRPDAMRLFVDAAHACGIGVILDVVYNHIGPDGNYLKRFADEYFTDLHETDWGEAINFYDAGSAAVREFFIHNAGYWIDEFHLDGLRLDATQNIYDESDEHVIAALTRHARVKAGKRSIVVVAENEAQDAKLVRPCAGSGDARTTGAGSGDPRTTVAKEGYGLDGVWNDDFHHSAVVALSGHNEAYYSDYLGRPEELLAACKQGYLYQGQWSQWQEKRRGTPARDVPPWAFITFLENHDQVSNSLGGKRLRELSSAGRYRAMTALLLLGPGTPMLFHGQEFGATTPYLFFADHHAELAKMVHNGRKEFLSQFPSLAAEESQAAIDDPAKEETFRKCRLDLTEREKNEPMYRMHKDLLRLRREEAALVPRDRPWFDGAVLNDQAFTLRYFGERDCDDRLLLVNLGTERPFDPQPEPLLAAPEGMKWQVRWSSEDLAYGGSGTPDIDLLGDWKLLGEAALWLGPEEVGPRSKVQSPRSKEPKNRKTEKPKNP